MPATLPQRLKAIRLDQRLVSRNVLAFFMIVVAAFGAAAAYWIAHDEQSAASVQRQLTRGRMVEIVLRQAIVGDWSVRASLEERQKSHRSRAEDLEDNADRVRATDPQQAGQLDMLAQQEQMLANLTGTLLVPFRAWGSGDTAEQQVDERVSSELAVLGFSAPPDLKVESAPASPESNAKRPALTHEAAVHSRLLQVWRPLAERIHAFEGGGPTMAFTVVLFVAALALLTVADLTQRWVRVSNAAILAGAASALGAVSFALWFDWSSWHAFAVAAGLSLVLGGAFRALGMFEASSAGETPHTPELEPRQYSGAHLFLRHVHNQREAIVIMLIAATVLLSSVVGLWYTVANTEVSKASQYAFDSEAALTNMDGERWLLGSAGAITPTLEFFGVRVRCAFASQAAVLPPADASPTMIAMLQRDRERNCGALDSDRNKRSADWVDNAADFDSGQTPGVKVFAEIRNRGWVNPYHLYALADGYVSLAERWETKSTLYILDLMLFAIALYLFGHSLGMGEGAPANALAMFGGLVMVVTFGAAVSVHRNPVMPAPTLPATCPAPADGSANATPIERAAEFYGDARALLDVATTPADYQKAADLFGCALTLRPDFGRAQYDRSRADSLISQDDIDSRYWNFPTKSRMAEIAASDARTREAIENAGWTPTPRFLNSQGFNTELAGIASGKLETIKDGLKILEQAIAAGGLTASDGRTLDAVKLAKASASDLSVYRMLFTNLGLGQLAFDERVEAAKSYQAAVDGLRLAEDRELVASSLSDLNTLEAHCADLHGASASATCADIDAGIADARRMLLLGKSAAQPGSGYARIGNISTWVRPSRVGWSADVSGFDADRDLLSVVWSSYSTDWKVWRVVQPLFKTVDMKSLVGTGRVQRVTVYDNSPSYCLPPGTYRAEFFLNGVRVPRGDDKGVAVSGYDTYRSRELDVAFCGPADWKLSSFRENREGRHLVRAFTTSTNKSALYLFTFFSPKNPADAETRSPVARAWNLLKRLTTAPPSDDVFYRAASKFTGCQNPIEPGTVLWRYWADGNGLVHIALVMGDAAPNGQACQVLESVGDYYDRTDAQLLGRAP